MLKMPFLLCNLWIILSSCGHFTRKMSSWLFPKFCWHKIIFIECNIEDFSQLVVSSKRNERKRKFSPVFCLMSSCSGLIQWKINPKLIVTFYLYGRGNIEGAIDWLKNIPMKHHRHVLTNTCSNMFLQPANKLSKNEKSQLFTSSCFSSKPLLKHRWRSVIKKKKKVPW